MRLLLKVNNENIRTMWKSVGVVLVSLLLPSKRFDTFFQKDLTRFIISIADFEEVRCRLESDVRLILLDTTF